MLLEQKLFVHIPKNAGCTIRLNPEISRFVIDANPKTHISKEYITENRLCINYEIIM